MNSHSYNKKLIAKDNSMFLIIFGIWFLLIMYFDPKIISNIKSSESIWAKISVGAFILCVNSFWLMGIYHELRTSSGKFWVKTKQLEGYSDQQIAFYIQGMIGHETDGTSASSLGHRKIIIAKIQGNPSYDPKASVEELVSYENIKQLGDNYKQKIHKTNKNFGRYFQNGENHPNWGNGQAILWVTNPKGTKWGYMDASW